MEKRNSINGKLPRSMMGVNKSNGEPEEFLIDDEWNIHKAFSANAEEGCTLLFKKYFSPLCNHVVRFVYSRSAAEDIVSEVFCKFWENEAYRKVKNFRCYLFCSVRNRALTYVKLHFKNETDAAQEEWLLDDWSRTPESYTAMEELQHCLKELVQQMPPQRRTVFILSRFEEKSNAEIAKQMRLSVRTVESYLSIALDFIRRGLKDYVVSPAKKEPQIKTQYERVSV